MGESELHHILKEIGLAWLWNQRCTLIATEVSMPRTLRSITAFTDEQFSREGLRSIIDVLGVGIKPEKNRYFKTGEIQLVERPYCDEPIEFHVTARKPDIPMIRGIEVKVSKTDFNAGYISTGCNYNYVLAPMKMINKKDLPSYVGLIEFNKYKFSIKWLINQFKYRIEGVKVVKHPKWKDVDESRIHLAIRIIGERATRMVMTDMIERLENLPTWSPEIEVYQ